MFLIGINIHSFFLGVITCCILLCSMYFINNKIYNNNNTDNQILTKKYATENAVKHYSDDYRRLSNNLDDSNLLMIRNHKKGGNPHQEEFIDNMFRINHNFNSPHYLDKAIDCNNNTYLSLKRKYISEGGIVFKSCSLELETINNAAIFTDTVNGRSADAHIQQDSVRSIALDKDTLEFLRYIHNRGVFPFQTLNFKLGTEQHMHSDVVHFDTLPTRGLMTAAWVALEDIHPDSGPLEWIPGSHKLGLWDYDELGLGTDLLSLQNNFLEGYNEYEKKIINIIERLKLKVVPALLKKGETFIWAASLLHGGSKRKQFSLPEFTRKSQVTHYFLIGAQSYWTPRKSMLAFNKIVYKCEVPICLPQQMQQSHYYKSMQQYQHTDCENIQQTLFKERKRTFVDQTLSWTKENCN